MPPLMTKRQLTDFLGISTRTIDLYRRLGLVRSIKIRGTVRFPAPYVIDLLTKHQEPAIA